MDPAGVVDEVGVDRPTILGILDPAPLGESEVAAFAHDPAPQFGRVDADRVVGSIAGIIVTFGCRLDVGAYAAIPEKIYR